jgi:hypothetical protein
MGLGGWMYDGVDRHTVLGDTADPNVPGLGFRYDTDDRWSIPNPTGLPGVLEGYCPPHYKDMREATEAVIRRKFGDGGVYNTETPGAWKDSYGKFPATVPSIFLLTYRQAQHIDLDFYDHYFKPGAYLSTHTNHMRKWHGE